MTTITFLLNNPSTIFLPGMNFEGCVCVNFSRPLTVKDIVLKWKKIVETDISELFVNSTGRFSECLCEQKILEHASGNETRFSFGNYTFPFSYQLPSTGLQTSFSSDLGSIRYCIQATVKYDFLDAKTKAEHPFCVLEQINLSISHLELQKPVEFVRRRDCSTCCCLNRGHVEVKFVLSKTAYASGESFCFSALISNKTRKTLENVSVLIKRKITYKGITRSYYKKNIYENINEIPGPRVAPGEIKNWEVRKNEVFISPTWVTIETFLIKVRYAIQIRVEVPDELPIVGTIHILMGSEPSTNDDYNGYGTHAERIKSKKF